MITIGLVIRPDMPEAVSLAIKVLEWANWYFRQEECGNRAHDENGYGEHEEVSFAIDASSLILIQEKDSQGILKILEERNFRIINVDRATIASVADPIISLGGDGTLISVAKYVKTKGHRLIGVNFGHLGFLTEIGPSELLTVIEKFFDGECYYDERILAQAQVKEGNQLVMVSQAVNEVLITKSIDCPLPSYEVLVSDGEEFQELMTIRADGVMVTTPTGSTAYSLAAGGSIIYPTLNVLMVTPLNPHSLAAKPIILPGHFKVKITEFNQKGGIYCVVDGQEKVNLRDRFEVVVSTFPQVLQLVSKKQYFDILKNKLNWALPNRNAR